MPGPKRWREGCAWLGVPALHGRSHCARGEAWLRRAAAGIERRRAEGFSVRKIAERLGVAPITIHRWRRAAAALPPAPEHGDPPNA